MRAVPTAVLVLVVSVAVAGQGTTTQFDAASVKPNRSGARSRYIGLGISLVSGDIVYALEHISFGSFELRRIIQIAYGISASQGFALVGGREDLLSSRYDIAATVPKDTSGRDAMGMLRSLLADRFKLRIHKEARETPVYTVTVARAGRLGRALLPTQTDCAVFAAVRGADPTVAEPLGRNGKPICWRSDTLGPAFSMGSASPISGLLLRAQGFVDRPLVDRTGLTGSYEWELSFSLMPDAPNAVAPSISTAFQEQLGLKLEPRTAPVDVWVIDSVELPTAD